MEFDNLTKEERQQILQEGIVDWIRGTRDAYQWEASSPEKAGGVAGAIGTGLGKAYKYGRDKLRSRNTGSKLTAAVTAGVTRAASENKVGMPTGYYLPKEAGYARISGTQKFIVPKQSPFAKSLQNKKYATGTPSWRASKPSGSSNQTGFASLVK